MSLINIDRTIELDVYDHDTTPSVIKTIQMDESTRTVFAMIQNARQNYDIGQNTSVSLTVLRPDKTKVQITGQTFSYNGTDGTMYGAKADLSDVALAVKGNLKAQFKFTSGEQELRTEIFTINNGEALDAGDGDWAGDLDGHNLDEMAESIEDLSSDVSEIQGDVSTLKEDLQDKADKEDLDILVNGYSGGENLFNPDDATDGQALISNGSTTASANKFVSEYMPVLSDYGYKYRGGTPNIVFIASYDSNKTFIDGSFATGVSEYTTPVNAKYVRITDYLIYKSVAQFYAVSTDGMRETIDNLESALDIGAISDGSPLEASATYNALIMGTGEISSTSNTLFVLRKYAVEKGKVYAIKGTQVSVRYDAYGLASFSESNYTGSKINSDLIIYGTGGTATNYYVTFTAPTNGYIYLLLYDINKPKLELYDAVLLSKLMYKLTNSNKDVVKIQAFGDSITDDSWRTDKTTWLTLLPDYLTQRTLSIKNEGVGGSHIGHGRVNSDTGKYHDLEYNYVYDLMTNADIFDPTSDIIVMFVGTNDFNSSPLGQWGDSTVDTFYGAAKMVCEYISQNTSALFLVVTPIARPDDADSSKQLNADGERVNGYGATLRDYAEALIKTCDFYQFPVIDLFHDIGWNKTNVRAWLDATGVHPSVKGSNAICAYISSEIKKHFGI